MPDEDFNLGVGLIANTDELEQQIEDGDYKAEVDMEGDGAPTPAGDQEDGGAVGFLGGSGKLIAAVAAIAAAVAFLEPIQELLGFLTRQVSLMIVPFVAAAMPVLQSIQKWVAKLSKMDLGDVLELIGKSIVNAIISVINGAIAMFNSVMPFNLPRISPLGIDTGPREFQQRGRMTEENRESRNLAFDVLQMGSVPPFGILSYYSELSDDAQRERGANNNQGQQEDPWGWLPW